MSAKNPSRLSSGLLSYAPAFAALGDRTRLLLVTRLADGRACSISQLTEGSKLTRQAITKHLRVLKQIGFVRCRRAGRQQLFEFNPRPFEDIRQYLDRVSAEWDQTLSQLQAFVED
jgi:DNA-binding transcriptional ArsR family regulator